MQQRGGESQRGTFSVGSGYSEKAQRTGKNTPTYLEPNSQSMQQEGRRIGGEGTGKPSYLEPIRNSMQKTGEGVYQPETSRTQPAEFIAAALNKGAIEKTHNRAQQRRLLWSRKLKKPRNTPLTQEHQP
jgi:hypothetical protein